MLRVVRQIYTLTYDVMVPFKAAIRHTRLDDLRLWHL